MEAAEGDTFRVSLRRGETTGNHIGLFLKLIDEDEECLYVVGLSTDPRSAVQLWNVANDHLQVKINDRIIEVNGVSSPASEMLQECSVCGVDALDLMLRRGCCDGAAEVNLASRWMIGGLTDAVLERKHSEALEKFEMLDGRLNSSGSRRFEAKQPRAVPNRLSASATAKPSDPPVDGGQREDAIVVTNGVGREKVQEAPEWMLLHDQACASEPAKRERGGNPKLVGIDVTT